MARIGVEQQALTDARYFDLGRRLGVPQKYAHEVGLARMIKVWNQCQERSRYTLPRAELEWLIGSDAEAVCLAGLAEQDGEEFRICGTEGRIEWLEEKRKIGREHGWKGAKHGKKGGRPKKQNPHEGVIETPNRGLAENPPPAPAPAPAGTPCSPPTRGTAATLEETARGFGMSPEEFADFRHKRRHQ